MMTAEEQQKYVKAPPFCFMRRKVKEEREQDEGKARASLIGLVGGDAKESECGRGAGAEAGLHKSFSRV